MATHLPIQCDCGAFRGFARDVSSQVGFRLICYCSSCQAFANHLGANDTTLDKHGGTEIFQMSPALLRITQGIDKLSCLRLTPKGPLRWFTECCKTPIGNTPPMYQLPFVGLICSCVNLDGQSREQVLGPVGGRFMVRYATSPVTMSGNGVSLSHTARMVGKMLMWRIRGDHRHSPFFDINLAKPIASTILLYERTEASDAAGRKSE